MFEVYGIEFLSFSDSGSFPFSKKYGYGHRDRDRDIETEQCKVADSAERLFDLCPSI